MAYFIHQTDIFHPHGDPDDHWDMATVYALAQRGKLDLCGVMFDYPPDHRAGDPATLAMGQIGWLTGITGIPFTVGTTTPMRDRRDLQKDLNRENHAAANWLCRVLENSQEQVIINIVGGCTDVALAGLLRPDLFESKCKCIYLNAGAANPGEDGKLEYNVRLNPHAYAAIFDLPCPIYWCPCWHRTEQLEIGTNGTWYSFNQGDVFSHLEDSMCNFFLYMLSRSNDPKYLRYLTDPVNDELKSDFGCQLRNLWSTAGILHAAGLSVDVAHGLLTIDMVKDPVFGFKPITVTCQDDGQTIWQPAKNSDRYIFTLRHPEHYAKVMTATLCELLGRIGKSNKKIQRTS